MGIPINKEEYLEFIQEYIDRDKEIMIEILGNIKKTENITLLMYMEELRRAVDNLSSNVELYTSSKAIKNKMTFFIDEESGQPVRMYDIKGKVQKKIMKRLKKEASTETGARPSHIG